MKVFDYSGDGVQVWTDRQGNSREYDLKKSLEILSDAGYEGPLCVEAGASEDVREGIGKTIAYVGKIASQV